MDAVVIASLYRRMVRARAFELAAADAWQRGSISGELHLGTGEEAIAAGLGAALGEHDVLALDHRGVPPLVAAGAPLRPLAAELLGREDGLCRGRGGHMHLFSRDPFGVSSGIVGAAGPAAVGFALANRQLGRCGAAVAMFGEGASNQGALLESFNLAVAWELPVLFLCKDNGWAITTRSKSVTGGSLVARAEGFGLAAHEVDGGDVEAVHALLASLLPEVRRGRASFVRASCLRLDGHRLCDRLTRVAAHPTSEEGREVLGASLRGALEGGAPLHQRIGGLLTQMTRMAQVRAESRGDADDPMVRARRRAKRSGLEVEAIEAEVAAEIAEAFAGLQEEAR